MSIYWSDSDDSIKNEHSLISEKKNELKRREVLETTCKDESELLQCEENIFQEFINKKSINKPMSLSDGWFCPCIAPPLVSEIGEDDFKVDNKPIVQFYKEKNKIKMVSFRTMSTS